MTLKGTVDPNGETITDCHFEYGADTNYGAVKPCASTPSGTSPVAVSAALTGLTPSAGYHARVVIKTAGGGTTPIVGGDQPFTTADPAAAATDAAGDVARDSATLNGTVTPNGEAITDCSFEYGTDTSYGTTAPCASTPSGSSATPVAAALTGLTASTAYHYRVVVTTDGGGAPVAGADREFTTLDPPPTPAGPSGDTGTPGGSTGDPGTPGGGTGNPGGSQGDPAGPGETDTSLTPSQLALAAHLSGTKTAGSDGTVTLGAVKCPLVCGSVGVTATMPAASAASAKKQPKLVTVGKGSAKLANGQSRKLTFKLTAKGKKALKKAKKLKLSVTVVVTGAGGKKVRVTRTIVVKAPKTRH